MLAHTQGGFDTSHKNNEGIKEKQNRPRDQSLRTKELSKAEIDGAVKKLIHEINNRYSPEKCLDIVKNPKKVPDEMNALFKGTGINGISVSNLNRKFFDYKRGKFDEYEFMMDVKTLYDALANGFDELVDECFYGGIKKNKNNLNEAEMSVAIQKMIKAINENYPCRTNNIPAELYELYRGSGINGISVENVNRKYIECKQGKYDIYEFMCGVEKLLDTLIDVYIELEDYITNNGVEKTEVER